MHDHIRQAVFQTQCVAELLANRGQLEIHEVLVGSSQITQQSLNGDTVVGLLRHIAIDDEIDHSKKGVAIDILCLTHLLNRLIAKP